MSRRQSLLVALAGYLVTAAALLGHSAIAGALSTWRRSGNGNFTNRIDARAHKSEETVI